MNTILEALYLGLSTAFKKYILTNYGPWKFKSTESKIILVSSGSIPKSSFNGNKNHQRPYPLMGSKIAQDYTINGDKYL